MIDAAANPGRRIGYLVSNGHKDRDVITDARYAPPIRTELIRACASAVPSNCHPLSVQPERYLRPRSSLASEELDTLPVVGSYSIFLPTR